MKVIHKYPLVVNYSGLCEVEMPKGADIISCQLQGEDITFWAIVNPKHKLKKRIFQLFGTGQAMEDYDKKHYEHVATVQYAYKDYMTTPLVWHVFEVHE